MTKDDMMRVALCAHNDPSNLSKNEGKVIEINLLIIHLFLFVMPLPVAIARSCH